jgi:large subunit ribosomal protein L13
VQKTYYPKAADIYQEWFVVDATSQTLGRLASKIAHVLLGKHKPSFTPGVEMGDYIIVINAEKITVTGMKMTDKYYYHYSGYPSGMKSISLQDQLSKHPDRVIRRAVWGMLPHNRYGRQLIKKLKIYRGAEHPHAAQQPKPLV